LECLTSLPAEGMPNVYCDVVVSLLQHIILHKPVGELKFPRIIYLSCSS